MLPRIGLLTIQPIILTVRSILHRLVVSLTARVLALMRLAWFVVATRNILFATAQCSGADLTDG